MDNNHDAPARRNIKRIIIKGSIGFFVLIGFSLAAAGFFLKQGIHIKDLTVGRISISDCTLIWKDKLELRVDTVLITGASTPQSSAPDIKAIRKALYTSQRFGRFFSVLAASNLSVGGESIAVNLTQEDEREYTLTLTTELTDFESRLIFEADEFRADLTYVYSRRFNSEARGQIRLEAGTDQFIGTISTIINGSFPVTVDFIADTEQISFEGKEAGEILEITSLVDLFGLSHNIQRWITDYLSGSRYYLKSFKGQFPWATPGVILDTLEAEVRVDDTEYTFAPGLDPVKGKYTDVSFSKGVLAIKPHDATFYGQDGGESWLDINFNDPSNIILTAYIKTTAVANDDILTLLKYYGITLPFKQIGGTTDTDLRLVINLNKLEIGAEGVFEISEGLVSYDGTVYKVGDVRIFLKNSDVTLEQLKVSYKELFVAQVKGTIQAKDGEGDLDILLEQVTIDANGSKLNLDESLAGVHANYHFDSQGHVLDAGPSSWLLDSKRIDVGSFRAPVFLEDFSLELPSVRVGIPPGIEADLSGSLSIKRKKVDITCDISKYHVNDLELLSPHVSLDIDYDQDWVFRIEETIQWSLSNIPVMLYPSEFRLDDQFFKVSNSRISYGTYFDSRFSGQFNHRLSEGTFYLKKIDVTNRNFEENIHIGDETVFEMRSEGGRFIVSCPELVLKISSDEDKNWSASFGDLSALYSRSKLLQRYKINAGSLTILSENGKKPYKFSADIASPSPFLIDGDGPVDELAITGKLTDHGITATVNEKIRIDYADNKLNITSDDIGFNVPALISLSKDLPQSAGENQDKNTALLLSLNAENGYLYLSPNSKILTDRIELEYTNGTIAMRLTHGPGRIVMKVEGDHFLADGSNLNDTFMGALIQDSSFVGGQMFLSAMGSFDEFSALFEIRDTVLTNLATLNNVMALLNTVPALISFSWPEYDFTGLPLDSAVVGLKFKNKLATFESMEFISPSLQASGIGWIDFSERLMDIDVSLTTQRKDNLRKIPVAGYILHGKKGEASMTIKIKSGFDNPDVTHSLFKDIASKPFKVLFRALGLPVRGLEEMSRESEN
jgi:hypothetical protein